MTQGDCNECGNKRYSANEWFGCTCTHMCTVPPPATPDPAEGGATTTGSEANLIKQKMDIARRARPLARGNLLPHLKYWKGIGLARSPSQLLQEGCKCPICMSHRSGPPPEYKWPLCRTCRSYRSGLPHSNLPNSVGSRMRGAPAQRSRIHCGSCGLRNWALRRFISV